MKIIFLTLALASLTACSGAFNTSGGGGGSAALQSVHGYGGNIDTPVGIKVSGVPNIMPGDSTQVIAERGGNKDSVSLYQTEDFTATGEAAVNLSLMRLCLAVPDAGKCQE